MNSTDTIRQYFIINQLTTTDSGYPNVTFEIPAAASLQEVIEAFEAFLVGVTFELPKGAKLGLIYDEETEKKNVEEKYGLTSDSAPATPQTTWPDTWSISHPICTPPIGSIIPATTWSTTTTTDSGVSKSKKKKNGKRKNKGSSKR